MLSSNELAECVRKYQVYQHECAVDGVVSENFNTWFDGGCMAYVRQFDYAVPKVDGGGARAYSHFRKPVVRAEWRLKEALEAPKDQLALLKAEFTALEEDWALPATDVVPDGRMVTQSLIRAAMWRALQEARMNGEVRGVCGK